MASNFRISLKRNRDNLHIILKGDFDGTSAFELVNTLEDQRGTLKKVFINTARLSKIHPFGQNILSKRLNALRKTIGWLVFTGDYRHAFTP
jgi:hypothetical protein